MNSITSRLPFAGITAQQFLRIVIADGWQLEVHVPEGKTRTLRPAWIRQDVPLVFTLKDGKEIKFKPSDMLYLKTASNPVVNGGKVSGFFFPLEDIPRAEAQKVGTKLRLCARDIANIQICGERTIGGDGGSEPPYFPGIEPEGPATKQP